jgi:hypothetical protein
MRNDRSANHTTEDYTDNVKGTITIKGKVNFYEGYELLSPSWIFGDPQGRTGGFLPRTIPRTGGMIQTQSIISSMCTLCTLGRDMERYL